MKYKIKLSTILSISILLIIVIMSIFAPILSKHNPLEINMANSLLKPCSEHLLGTDELGRDILSRVMYGGRQSILLAVVATTISMGIGLVIGIVAGFYGGKVDAIITSISNIFQGLPSMSMMIVIAAIMGPGVKSMLVAIVITSWVSFSRLVRGEVMKIKKENYIDGIISIGASNIYIMVNHIFPNLLSYIIVIFTTKIASTILSVASLSFLGLGLQPPTPDWGVMINDARMYFRTNPIMAIAPGICIMAISLSVNVLGDLLREKLDIRKDTLNEY